MITEFVYTFLVFALIVFGVVCVLVPSLETIDDLHKEKENEHPE